MKTLPCILSRIKEHIEITTTTLLGVGSIIKEIYNEISKTRQLSIRFKKSDILPQDCPEENSQLPVTGKNTMPCSHTWSKKPSNWNSKKEKCKRVFCARIVPLSLQPQKVKIKSSKPASKDKRITVAKEPIKNFLRSYSSPRADYAVNLWKGKSS